MWIFTGCCLLCCLLGAGFVAILPADSRRRTQSPQRVRPLLVGCATASRVSRGRDGTEPAESGDRSRPDTLGPRGPPPTGEWRNGIRRGLKSPGAQARLRVRVPPRPHALRDARGVTARRRSCPRAPLARRDPLGDDPPSVPSEPAPRMPESSSVSGASPFPPHAVPPAPARAPDPHLALPAEPPRRADVARVFLAAFAILAMLAWPRDLFDADEGRYAAVALDMLRSGDFITPREDGMRFLDKPPLVYWAAAASMEAFGPTPFSARIPCLAAGAALAAVVFLFGAAWTGSRRAGWAGA